jgi:hypothetical protein
MIRKNTTSFLSLLIAGILAIGFIPSSFAQNKGLPMSPLFGRKYKPGEKYSYRLTLREIHNGKWTFTNIAICELTVETDSAGVPYDVLRWTSKKVLTEKDTVDQTDAALSVKPYRISLDGRGRIDLPKILVPLMTEPIQDFNTVFVAVSPNLLGISDLKNVNDNFSIGTLGKGDFSNGADLLIGQDCLHISGKLSAITKETASIYTAFLPPDTPCLTYLTKDMETPIIKDTLNNFQMVNPAGNDLYIVGYGREFFTVTTTIRRSDGKIIKADMYNQVNMKLKINCNKSYAACQMDMPLVDQRILSIELL